MKDDPLSPADQKAWEKRVKAARGNPDLPRTLVCQDCGQTFEPVGAAKFCKSCADPSGARFKARKAAEQRARRQTEKGIRQQDPTSIPTEKEQTAILTARGIRPPVLEKVRRQLLHVATTQDFPADNALFQHGYQAKAIDHATGVLDELTAVWESNRRQLTKAQRDEYARLHESTLDHLCWMESGFESLNDLECFVDLDEGVKMLVEHVEKHGLIQEGSEAQRIFQSFGYEITLHAPIFDEFRQVIDEHFSETGHDNDPTCWSCLRSKFEAAE